jgi:hypothetical protein
MLSVGIKSHGLHRGYMPLTKQALNNSVESTFSFQIRKLKYIAKNLQHNMEHVDFIHFLVLGNIFKHFRSDEVMTQAREIYASYISHIILNK